MSSIAARSQLALRLSFFYLAQADIGLLYSTTSSARAWAASPAGLLDFHPIEFGQQDG
jgi:hypothetical protein